MSVRIRMKKMGRTHRPFFRICAMDRRSPRDGRVLEELGTYDPNLTEVDARAVLRADRVDYWLSVGAEPSEKCAVLIRKYGSAGTHLEAQKEALSRLAMPQAIPDPEPAVKPEKSEEDEAAATEETKAAEGSEAPAAEGETPAEQQEGDAAAGGEEQAGGGDADSKEGETSEEKSE